MFHLRIVLVLSIFIALFDGVSSQLHSGRVQLIKDALGWMTLRNNGDLLSDAELDQSFLTHLKDKYRDNLYYRTFVIAFMEAVVPRLTLNENDPCDPTYALKYKDLLTSSVTYGFQRLFTFDVYDNRKRNDDKYCDYRLGLICHPTARKCMCPEGSSMQPIDRSTSVSRCLLQENEICNLLDLSHEKDYSILKDNLHHLIFNLEKPPGCKMGTQCRFKQSDLTTPRCYDAKSGPWAPPYTDSAGNTVNEWRINYGEECTLGLYANSGSCISLLRNQTIGVFSSSVCFNFGPPRSISGSGWNNRTGFCVDKFGPYGISDFLDESSFQKSFYVFFFPYIHPRTVPLRGQELDDFYRRCLDASVRIHPNYVDPETGRRYDIQVHHEGGSCSVRKTKEYEDLWKYFMGLAKDPPPGQDYVPEATKSQLDSKLQEFIDLTNYTSRPGRICKVYHHFDRSSPYSRIKTYPSLKCVKNLTSAGRGNNGRCQAPGNLAEETIVEAQKFQDYLDADAKKGLALLEDKGGWNLRKDILRVFPEHMDKQCSEPSLVCPANHTCFDDYSDERGMYDRRTCEFKKSTQELDLFCHESRHDLSYGKCEEVHLNKTAFQEFEKMGEYSTLRRGDGCDYDLQKYTRQWIKDERPPGGMNRYVFLAKLKDLERSVKEGKGGGICDFSKLQECLKDSVCGCLTINSVKYVPRNVTVAGIVYQSDYCYQPSGECGLTIDKMDFLTKSEAKKLRQHYGDECDGGNICVYFDKNTGNCRDENTGNTGYEAPKVEPPPLPPSPPPPPPPPPPVTPGSQGSGDLESGYGFAGASEDLEGNKLLTGLILTFGLSAFIPLEI